MCAIQAHVESQVPSIDQQAHNSHANALAEFIFGTIIDDPDDDLYEYGEDDGSVDDLLNELILSANCRYIYWPLRYHHSDVDMLHKINNFTPKKCRSILRMNWVSFMKLTALLFNHDVFQTTSPCRQEEVAAQIAVTLDRLGVASGG